MTSIYEDEYRQLIDKLVKARKKAGITQVQLAEKLGVTQPFISKYERCERRLDVVEYVRICKFLNHKPEVLVDMT